MPSSAPTTRNWSAGWGGGLGSADPSPTLGPGWGIPGLPLPPGPGLPRVTGWTQVTAAWIRRGQPLKTLEKQAPIWREGKRPVKKTEVGEAGGGRAGRAAGHLRAPWGLGGARGTMISGREGPSQGRGGTPASHLPGPSGAPSHLRILPVLHGGPGGGEPRGAVRTWGRRRWGSCRHRPAVNSSSSPTRVGLQVPQDWTHPGGWREGLLLLEAQQGTAPRTGPA